MIRTQAFATNKPTHYLLDHGDFFTYTSTNKRIHVQYNIITNSIQQITLNNQSVFYLKQRIFNDLMTAYSVQTSHQVFGKKSVALHQ